MLKYHQDNDRKRIEVIAGGDLTLPEATNFVNRQLLGGAWHFPVLFDMRDVQHGMSESEAAEFVQYIKAVSVGLQARGPVAFIVAKPEQRTLAASYAFLGKEARLRVAVFEDPAEAERWLASFPT